MTDEFKDASLTKRNKARKEFILFVKENKGDASAMEANMVVERLGMIIATSRANEGFEISMVKIMEGQGIKEQSELLEEVRKSI